MDRSEGSSGEDTSSFYTRGNVQHGLHIHLGIFLSTVADSDRFDDGALGSCAGTRGSVGRDSDCGSFGETL